MITSYKIGHIIEYNIENSKWYYLDNKEEANYFKPCPLCGNMPTKEGYDFCLGKLPGVKNACCGHGIKEGYIHFENDKTIKFNLTGIEND